MSTSHIERCVRKPRSLVVQALECLAHRRGSTLQEIVNYVSSTYGTDKAEARRLVLMGLKKAADEGVIQCDGSRYDILYGRGEDDIKQSVWKPQTLVVEALECLADERGSTPQDIVNYVCSTYGTSKREARLLVIRGLKKAEDQGAVKCNGFRYVIFSGRRNEENMTAARRRRPRKPCHSLKRRSKRRRRSCCWTRRSLQSPDAAGEDRPAEGGGAESPEIPAGEDRPAEGGGGGSLHFVINLEGGQGAGGGVVRGATQTLRRLR